MTKDDLKECPFCGSRVLDIYKDEMFDSPEYCVTCAECYAHGGNCLSESQAMILWNIRTKNGRE